MPLSTIPRADHAYLGWASHLSTTVSTSPGVFGVSTGLAADLQAGVRDFEGALALCEPGERSKSRVTAKNESRKRLEVTSRLVINAVNATATVTNAQKEQAGIPVRKSRQPIGPITTSPVVAVESVKQNVVTVVLRGLNTERRGMIKNAAGAVIITHIGPTAPADPSEWVTWGLTGKSKVELEFPISAEPFSKVWISAAWFNPSKVTGPLCPPVATNLGTWVASSSAGMQMPTSNEAILKAA
jgi:hypothetical protein